MFFFPFFPLFSFTNGFLLDNIYRDYDTQPPSQDSYHEIFLHLDYMYRVDENNERPLHRTHNPLSGQPPHYTMHHHVTPWHYHRQRVHPHEKTN